MFSYMPKPFYVEWLCELAARMAGYMKESYIDFYIGTIPMGD
jgi:hypothetical protein